MHIFSPCVTNQSTFVCIVQYIIMYTINIPEYVCTAILNTINYIPERILYAEKIIIRMHCRLLVHWLHWLVPLMVQWGLYLINPLLVIKWLLIGHDAHWAEIIWWTDLLRIYHHSYQFTNDARYNDVGRTIHSVKKSGPVRPSLCMWEQ